MDAQGGKAATVYRHDRLCRGAYGGGKYETRLCRLYPQTVGGGQACPSHPFTAQGTGTEKAGAGANIRPSGSGISGNQAACPVGCAHPFGSADMRRERHGQGTHRPLRAEKPFVTADCGALSPTLAQSAFFGHVKGAFTGADSAHVGYFQEAEGGTLFLDEVGNLPMEMQRMLLRVIQEHRYRPIGAKEDKTADVRIVAATNDDLQKAVTEKRFREDLLYRLKEYTITVPPLRDCQEDILPLAEFFLGLANKELERNIKGFNASANNILLAYPWPGNVRELKQKIQTAVLHAEGNMITDNDLELGREQLSSFPSSFALKSEAEEKERIIRALEQAKGKRHLAAKLLGIGRTTLYKKMKEYGIEL